MANIRSPQAQGISRDDEPAPNPVTVRDHLMLGLTTEIARNFIMFELGWWKAKKLGNSGDPKRDVTQEIDYAKGLALRSTYEDVDKWIGTAYPGRITDYDLNVQTRYWLKRNDYEEMSVCEAILKRGKMRWACWEGQHTKGGMGKVRSLEELGTDTYGNGNINRIGEAQVFLSHVQVESPEWTIRAMATINGRIEFAKRVPQKQSTIWLDTFSLRQCAKNDFEPEEVIALI